MGMAKRCKKLEFPNSSFDSPLDCFGNPAGLRAGIGPFSDPVITLRHFFAHHFGALFEGHVETALMLIEGRRYLVPLPGFHRGRLVLELPGMLLNLQQSPVSD